LKRAVVVADRVAACQRPDGGWAGGLFKPPVMSEAVDDKCTAIWAYFFYDLYRETKNPRDLAVARAATGWCLRHQDWGNDPHTRGAMVTENSMAYVRRRPMVNTYSTVFFGLALLEELKLATP
jgi:hypothetical protein